MKKALLFSFVFVWICALHSQDTNLVYNPSFEKYYSCPVDYVPMDNSHKLLPGWTYPTQATPDYFNRCGKGIVHVPDNFAGNSEPRSGDGYVGAILSGTSESYREYLQGELSMAMIPGQKYCVTYWYKLASYSQISVDQLDLYFSNEKIAISGKEAMGVHPQIKNQDGLFLDNINDWQRVCIVYDAKGGEKFFTVGNFSNYDNTNYVITDKNMKNMRNKAYAYYYFDDFTIRPLKNCKDCPCVPHNFKSAIIDTFYTGGLDPVTGNITEIINDGSIQISMIGGTPPYSVSWSNGAKGTGLFNLPAGVYTYEAKDKYSCLSTGKVTFVEPEIIVDEFSDGLQNIEEGEAIVLENIFFEYNKSTLLEESFKELDVVVKFLKENDIKLIEISGHTDADGSESYNQKLSDGRAKAVVKYLVSKGVDATRLKAVGYGEEFPIETNFTDEGKGVNRRVEFRLLKK